MSDLVFGIWPVDPQWPTTWPFGAWDTSIASGKLYQHRGLDIGCPTGTLVSAPAEGRAVAPTNDGSFGIAVCIEHPDTGLFSLYAHLSAALVHPGEVVYAGQSIGHSGNTGLSSGPHLHWQVCVNSQFPTDISYSRDPASYYQEDNMTRDEVLALLAELHITDAAGTPSDATLRGLNAYIDTRFAEAHAEARWRDARKAFRP